MKGIAKLLLIFPIFCHSLAWAQCPDRKKIWDRVLYLRDSSMISAEDQLNEIAPYLEQVRKCPVKDDSALVLLTQRLGKLYQINGDYLKCIELSNEALRVLKVNNIKIAGEDLLAVYAYNNLRICYESFKNSRLEKTCMDSTIALCMQLNKGYDIMIPLLFKRADWYIQKADYYSCINDVDLGESILKSIGTGLKDFDYYSNNFIIWKTNALAFLKRFDDAADVLNERIVYCKKNKAEKTLAALYSLYAQVLEAKGDIKGCLHYFELSKAIHQKYRSGNQLAETLDNIGFLVYSKNLHDPDKALGYYFKALTTCSPKESVNILGNIASAYVQKGDFKNAEIYFKKGMEAIKQGTTEATILEMAGAEMEDNFGEYISSFLLAKADASVKQYKSTQDITALNRSLVEYHIIDAFFDKIRDRQSEIASKLSWRQNNRRLYENAIEAAYLKKDMEQALYFFEKSRAVLLRDQLKEHYSLPAEELHQLAQTRRFISELKKQSDTLSVASNTYKEIQKKLYALRLELESQLETIKKTHPNYYQNQLDTSLISSNDIRTKLLPPFSSLVEIYSGDSAVYVLVLTATTTSLQQINKPLYDSLSFRYNQLLSSYEEINTHYSDFLSTSQNLYHLLFDQTSLPEGRTLVSPDGKYFPFEALITGMLQQQVHYFLATHSVSYCYSANYLISNIDATPKTAGGFLGMAPVNFPAARNLSPLTGSEASLKRIGNYFNNSLLLTGEKSTQDAFLNNYSNYSVIQLYTHAKAIGRNEEPEIWFSDSSLTLSDLNGGTKPITRLIILSACETGVGKLYKSEGVFSFNRGFATIGIPASISSLWEIDSKSTYAITELFYKYLSEGLPSDIALQKAKMQFMQNGSKENTLPYYWAAPILVGKAESIPISKSDFKIWIYAAMLLTLVAISWWFINRRKKLVPKNH